MKIGITGANSFLGRNLVKALIKEGHDALSFSGDIRNPAEVAEFVKKCNTIYHFAGCNRGVDKDVYETNMLGGANIVASSAAIGDRHIIFPSSNYLLRDPEHPYSVSKRAVEAMLRQLANINNCRSTILRLSNTYGLMALPFHVSVVATFCWYEANGYGDKMPVAGDGQQLIELVPVDVVMNRLLEVLEEVAPFSFYEIRGSELSVIELSVLIRESNKRKLYPLFDEIVDFFSKNTNIKRYSESDICSLGKDLISVKQIHSDICLKKYGVLTLSPGYQRHIYQTILEKIWLCIETGRIALDVFTQEEEYVNTILIDGNKIKCVELIVDYKYRIRNLSPCGIPLNYYKK